MILICFLLSWCMVFGACWIVAYHWKTGFVYVKRLHQVPCHKCKYFTNSCYLKCYGDWEDLLKGGKGKGVSFKYAISPK
jgi:hypothetical protein